MKSGEHLPNLFGVSQVFNGIHGLFESQLSQAITYPHFAIELKEVSKSGEFDKPGKKSVTLEPALRILNFDGRFTDTSYDVRLPIDPEDESANLTVNKVEAALSTNSSTC